MHLGYCVSCYNFVEKFSLSSANNNQIPRTTKALLTIIELATAESRKVRVCV